MNDKEPLIDPEELGGNVSDIDMDPTLANVGKSIDENIEASAFIRGMQNRYNKLKKTMYMMVLFSIALVGVIIMSIVVNGRVIIEKNEIIAEKDNIITEKDNIIAEKNKNITELIIEKDKVITENSVLSESYNILKEKHDTLSLIIDSIKEENQDMKSSILWYKKRLEKDLNLNQSMLKQFNTEGSKYNYKHSLIVSQLGRYIDVYRLNFDKYLTNE